MRRIAIIIMFVFALYIVLRSRRRRLHNCYVTFLTSAAMIAIIIADSYQEDETWRYSDELFDFADILFITGQLKVIAPTGSEEVAAADRLRRSAPTDSVSQLPLKRDRE